MCDKGCRRAGLKGSSGCAESLICDREDLPLLWKGTDKQTAHRNRLFNEQRSLASWPKRGTHRQEQCQPPWGTPTSSRNLNPQMLLGSGPGQAADAHRCHDHRGITR